MVVGTARQCGRAEGLLVRIVTNVALDRLRSAKARREAYVGSAARPLLTSPDVADRAELAESVSIAMLVVLESLTPEERAVFVLREVFGFRHAEIARSLGRSEARSGSSRTGPASMSRPAGHGSRWTAASSGVTERFLSAAVGGDLDGLMTVLAPDVVLVSDGGGKAQAPRRPIVGEPMWPDSWSASPAVLTWASTHAILPEEVTVNGSAGLLVIGHRAGHRSGSRRRRRTAAGFGGPARGRIGTSCGRSRPGASSDVTPAPGAAGPRLRGVRVSLRGVFPLRTVSD